MNQQPNTRAARLVGQFEGYVDGEPSVIWHDPTRMPEVGEKLYAAPAPLCHGGAPSAPAGASVDTLEFGDLLTEYATGDAFAARAALIAHIDQHVASQVRAARDAALEEAARLSEEMFESGEGGAGTKAAAAAIRALKATTISHSGEGAAQARDAARWRFMMAIADNEEGPEFQEMERQGDSKFDDARPKSVQLEEMVDASRLALQSQGAVGAAPLTRCAAGRDGECGHAQCPQLRDNEPRASGRHCPLDNERDDQ